MPSRYVCERSERLTRTDAGGVQELVRDASPRGLDSAARQPPPRLDAYRGANAGLVDDHGRTFPPENDAFQAAMPWLSGLDTPGGRLLRDHLLLLEAELPHMDTEQAARMAEATWAMVALAAAKGVPRRVVAARPVVATQVARLHALIRTRLGSATFGPARLSQLSRISRSQLYRLFEPHGGVACFIQRERLAAARRALSDPCDPRSIREIAESVGLFDPSSFSRMFRRSFGVSPRQLRLVCRCWRLSPRDSKKQPS